MSKRKLTIQERYPALFPEKFGIECESGWDELVIFTCKYFQGKLDGKAVDEIRFSQIKEKFGLLRIYFNVNFSPNVVSRTTFEELHHTISIIEEMSGLICEDCGEIKTKTRNVGITQIHGWLRTLCDKCAKETIKRMK